MNSGGEGDDRGWDGWMASPTLWTWVWISSRSWWWAGKPVVLQSVGGSKELTRLSYWTELHLFSYSLQYVPSTRITGHSTSMFNILKYAKLFSNMAAPFYNHTSSFWGVPIFSHAHQHLLLCPLLILATFMGVKLHYCL